MLNYLKTTWQGYALKITEIVESVLANGNKAFGKNYLSTVYAPMERA